MRTLTIFIIVGLCWLVTTEARLVELTEENFDSATKEGKWLLEFLVADYAPWCPHCQALAPVLKEAAAKIDKEASGLNIGTIDATKEKGVAEKFTIDSYPTLKYFLRGKSMDYLSGREVKDFVDFAKRLSRPAITAIDAKNIDLFLESNKIAFILFSNGGRAESLIGEIAEQFLVNEIVSFGKSNDLKIAEKILKGAVPKDLPFLVCQNDNITGDLAVFTGAFQYDSVSDWIVPRTLPIFPEITMANWKQVIEGKKLSVLIAIDKQKHSQFLNVMKTVASKHSEYQFGYIDTEEYPNFVDRKFGMKELPSFVIFNGVDEWYYNPEKVFSSEQEVEDFFAQVTSGKVSKRGPGSGFVGLATELAFKLMYTVKDNPVLGISMFAMALIPILLIRLVSTGDEEEEKDKAKAKAAKKD